MKNIFDFMKLVNDAYPGSFLTIEDGNLTLRIKSKNCCAEWPYEFSDEGDLDMTIEEAWKSIQALHGEL